MKKEMFILATILIFSLNLVYAEPFLQIQNIDSLQSGETLFGEINIPDTETFSGNLQKENIKFYKDRKQLAVEKDIISYNNKYYFYIYLTTDGNFSLSIENILYKNPENILQSKNIQQEIQVKKIEEIIENQTSTKILSIKPGFVYSSSQENELTLTNNGNTELNLTFSDDEPELNIQPQQTRKIYPFSNSSFSFFNISSYKQFSVPFIFISINHPDNFVPEEKNSIRIVPTYLHANLVKLSQSNQSIEIFNFAEQDFNVSISKSLDSISIQDKILVNAKSSKNLSFEITSENEGYFEDNIIFQYTENNLSKKINVPIYIYIFPENATQEQMIVSDESCEELGGNSCNSGESCDGQSTITKAGEYCCIGTCTQVKKETSYSWLIGIGILILLAVAGFFIFKKYKKVKPETPEQKLKQSEENFNKRTKGSLTRS